MLLWFILTGMSLLFVVIDIRTTPATSILKWGFILLTAYTGPFGAFLYVLGCRDPLPGLHERYVAARWKQVLGSTMHCVAGDGVGILTGAVIASLLRLNKFADLGLEYLLGFGFGWSIFQSLFMRDMVGGSYRRALSSTFIPELLSMNCLMAGMAPTMLLAKAATPASHNPSAPSFWFVMSMALLVGLITAYPMNWWLVSHHLKHGMITDRPSDEKGDGGSGKGMKDHHASGDGPEPAQGKSKTSTQSKGQLVSSATLARMTVLSLLVFGSGLFVAVVLGARLALH